MLDKDILFQEMYDRQGKLLGIIISPELWYTVEDKVAPIFKKALQEKGIEEKNEKEPIQDWENLKNFWDFKYPVDTDVLCEECGSRTDDWTKDEPRKFKLKAASLGGLVSFECLHCKARISKKHFKDKITSKTTPYKK